MDSRRAALNFRIAVKALTAAGTMQERMFEAYRILGPLSLTDDLPSEVRDDWASIKASLTRFKTDDRDEGDLLRTLSSTPDETLERMATRICDILFTLEDCGR